MLALSEYQKATVIGESEGYRYRRIRRLALSEYQKATVI
jgi:hypothetical protein